MFLKASREGLGPCQAPVGDPGSNACKWTKYRGRDVSETPCHRKPMHKGYTHIGKVLTVAIVKIRRTQEHKSLWVLGKGLDKKQDA